MNSAIQKFLRDEEGATTIEYGVIAGMMAVLLVVLFGPTGGFGTAISSLFARISTVLGKV